MHMQPDRAAPGDHAGAPAPTATRVDLIDVMFPTRAQSREWLQSLPSIPTGSAKDKHARLVARVRMRLVTSGSQVDPGNPSCDDGSATPAAEDIGYLLRTGRAANAPRYRLISDLVADQGGEGRLTEFSADESLAIEQALSERRRGHRGGLGRCQGRKSVDGVAYPRRIMVTLQQADVAILLRLGNGNVCAGMRELARRFAELAERPEMVGDGSAGGPAASESPTIRRNRFSARLDPKSEEVLRAAGGGVLSQGISRALVRVSQR